MNACHAPCTLYMYSFYTGTSARGHNLIKASATIGDWAFIFLHILNAVLLLETCATIRDLCYYYQDSHAHMQDRVQSSMTL